MDKDTPGKNKTASGTAESPNFSTFIMSLAVTALGHMGLQPEGGQETRIPVSLPLAAQTIDIISMLREKTAGNLEEHEQKLIDSLLYELRIKYVEQTSKQENSENGRTE